MNLIQLFTKELHFRKYAKEHFPQIYRFIAEKNYWLWIGIGTNVLLISFFALQLLQLLPQWYAMRNKKEEFISDALLWENIGNTYQNYKDAYFQSAIFSYQAKNLSQAQKMVEKALLLDATFTKAQSLQRIIIFENERERGE